ncbi:E3 ubiquitin-protein ligase RNF5 isoform X2 [Podarcis muralis]
MKYRQGEKDGRRGQLLKSGRVRLPSFSLSEGGRWRRRRPGWVRGSRTGNPRVQTATAALSNAISAWSLPEKLSLGSAATCTVARNSARAPGVSCVQGRNQPGQSHPSLWTWKLCPAGSQVEDPSSATRAAPRAGVPRDAEAARPSSWQDSLFLFIAIFFFFWLLSV